MLFCSSVLSTPLRYIRNCWYNMVAVFFRLRRWLIIMLWVLRAIFCTKMLHFWDKVFFNILLQLWWSACWFASYTLYVESFFAFFEINAFQVCNYRICRYVKLSCCLTVSKFFFVHSFYCFNFKFSVYLLFGFPLGIKMSPFVSSNFGIFILYRIV